MQLLRAQITKAQKGTEELTVFFKLFGSAHIKAVHFKVDEIDTRCDVINGFRFLDPL